MLKLSKKVEYGILALQYMAANKHEMLTAKKIAKNLDVSFEFLSKSLQKILKYNLIKSQQGIKGGYYLAKDPENISVMDVILSLGENPNIVACIDGEKMSVDECLRSDHCTLKNPMAKIQKKINKIFEETSIAELASEYHSNGNGMTNGVIKDKDILEFKNA